MVKLLGRWTKIECPAMLETYTLRDDDPPNPYSHVTVLDINRGNSVRVQLQRFALS